MDSDNTVELVCSATGNPTPMVSWQKEAEREGSFVSLPGKDGQWVLRSSVIKVQLSEDTYGAYRCVANNSQGSDDKSVKLSGGLCFPEVFRNRFVK